MRSPAVLVAACTAASAFKLPFYDGPLFSWAWPENDQQPLGLANNATTAATPVGNRVAIIGAGAGGSSAAFWIAKAKERYGLDIEVDVYDKNDYIGGRSTVVYPYGNTSFEPVELGASIFVKVNRNMYRATQEFDLGLLNFEEEDDVLGVWDGKEFAFTTDKGPIIGSWWSTLKILWRYGYTAPTKTNAIVKEMVDKFLLLYAPSAPQWTDIGSVASTLGWTEVVAQTMAEYLDLKGVYKRFSREVVDAATRVNYGQNVDDIHALEGMCSLAATGASSVKGGNFQVFEHFLAASKAKVYLNTKVKSITRSASGDRWALDTATGDKQEYRAVILAAPYHQAHIQIDGADVAPVPQQPYIHLHVTLLSTSSQYPNPAYFGLSASSKPPRSILTTYNGVRSGRHAQLPEFNSLTYHGLVRDRNGTARDEREWVVKIFSKTRVEDSWLHEVFGGKENVGWVLRKEWDAYPVLPPAPTYAPVRLADGLYYVNAFEPLISTMETETLAARNVADLVLRDHFDSAVCKTPREDAGEEYVIGWDC